MARIKIEDLPRDMKISGDIMKQIRGGINIRATDSLARLQDPLLLLRKTAVSDINYINIIDIPS